MSRKQKSKLANISPKKLSQRNSERGVAPISAEGCVSDTGK